MVIGDIAIHIKMKSVNDDYIAILPLGQHVVAIIIVNDDIAIYIIKCNR